MRLTRGSKPYFGPGALNRRTGTVNECYQDGDGHYGVRVHDEIVIYEHERRLVRTTPDHWGSAHRYTSRWFFVAVSVYLEGVKYTPGEALDYLMETLDCSEYEARDYLLGLPGVWTA